MRRQQRTGRQALGRLRDELSEREWLVLRMVADHRFLTTRQVEGFCFADHASALSAARICRRVLARLHDLHLLRHLDRRIGGVRAGSASYVWTLDAAGDRLLAQRSGEMQPRRRFREPSLAFLEHYLAVADVHLSLWTAAHAGQFGLDQVQTEPSCWRDFIGPSGARQTLRPDLYAVTVAGDYEDCWFIEVDRGTESLPRLLSKCAQYQAYRRSGVEQATRGVFPLVVWVMPSDARADALAAALSVAARGAAEPSPFRVTTSAGLLPLLTAGGGA